MLKFFPVIVLLLLALLIRLDFLLATNAVIDGDEAIVGLMAKHILEGHDIPTFYYGQHYMGSLEPITVALAFSIFGMNNWVLQLVPLAYSILFLFFFYLLAKELVSERASLIALLLGAFPPATLIIWSTKARGGFIEILCIGTIALLTSVRWIKNPKARTSLTVWTGLWLGLGWWVNNQILYFMMPIGLFMLLVCLQEKVGFLKTIKYFILGLFSFLIGSLPYWIYNLKNDFASLGMFNASNGSDVLDHAEGLVTTALPIILGAKRFWHTEDLFLYSSILVWLLLLLILTVYFKSRSNQLLSLLKGKVSTAQPLELLFVFFVTCLLVFTISSFGYLVKAPRYLLPAYIAILIITAYVIDVLWTQKKYYITLAILGLCLWFSWASSFLWGRSIPGEPIVFNDQRVAKDHTELLSWLRASNYSWVRTNYWIGYRLAFESNEEIRFLIFGEPYESRIDAYEKEGIKYGRELMPLVLVPDQEEYVVNALKAQGYQYQTAVLQDYVVIYDIKHEHESLHRITSDRFEVKVSDRPEYAMFAVDNDLATRWRSAKPQASGMYYSIEFKKPVRVKAIEYDTHEWAHDYPRGLQVDLIFADGTVKTICDDKSYQDVRYYLHGDSKVSFYIDYSNVVGIKLTQTNSHPVFDWTIAELAVFE